jgi:hypothetical protein
MMEESYEHTATHPRHYFADYFAAAALTGLLANGDRKTAVATAVEMAKKMIEETRQNDSA